MNENFNFNNIQTTDTTSEMFHKEYIKLLYKPIVKKMKECIEAGAFQENSLNFNNFTRCDIEDDQIVMQSYQLDPIKIHIVESLKYMIMDIHDTTAFSRMNDAIYPFVELCNKQCTKYGYKFFINSRYFEFPSNKYWMFEKKFCNIIPNLMVNQVKMNSKKTMFESVDAYKKFKQMCKENIHIQEIKIGTQITSNFNIAYSIPICDKDLLMGVIKC